jgi:hypothetical protein
LSEENSSFLMCVFHCHTPQTSLNVTSIRASKDVTILRSTFTQHSRWHGRKLSRMRNKVIWNFRFKKNKNNNYRFFSSLPIIFFLLCWHFLWCYVYVLFLSNHFLLHLLFILLPRAWELKVWSLDLHCRLSFPLACSLVECLCLCSHITGTATSLFYFYYLVLPWHLF